MQKCKCDKKAGWSSKHLISLQIFVSHILAPVLWSVCATMATIYYSDMEAYLTDTVTHHIVSTVAGQDVAFSKPSELGNCVAEF